MPLDGPQVPRHILVYGPPAAGKLTVARALADRHEMAVLDNHATIDPALRLFDFGTPEFAALVEELRATLLRAAAQAGRDVVSTLVFADPVDRPHVARLVAASASGGAATAFVQLLPARAVLEERVLDALRFATSKIKDLATLAQVLDSYDLETPINEDDLRIDNADLQVDDVVGLIAEHLVLGSD